MPKRKREVVMIDDDDDDCQVVAESASLQRSVREARRREKRVMKARDVSLEFEEQKKDGDAGPGLLSSMNTGEGSSKDAGIAGAQANADHDIFFMDLGNKRRATVRMFKGKVYVDIREFFGSEDDLRPGKKGITLTDKQWEVLKNSVDILHAYVASSTK